ncbi:MAG: type II toxin-antitoxin system VapC family toxin [Dehalococcoidia bacterium]
MVDTNVLVWIIGERRRLTAEAARTVSRAREVFVPAIVFWELAMLITRQRLRIGSNRYADVVALIVEDERVVIQPLTPNIGLRAAQLSLNQSMDPADQLIAATALELDLPLVTADERLQSLPGLRTIW